MTFDALSRETLADQVARQLLAYIEEHRLQPGALLPSSQQLAREFGVSRPVIREALRSLAGRSVIEVVNGKGAVVRPLSAQPLGTFFQRAMQLDHTSAQEMLEVRRGLERQSARLAAERRTDAELARLRERVGALREAVADVDGYLDLDVAFHVALAEAAHNTMLSHLVTSMRQALRASMDVVRVRQHPAVRLRVQDAHEAVVEAVAARDSAAAERAMEAHFEAIAHSLDRQEG